MPKKATIEWIPFNAMVRDPRIQRNPINTRVKRLASEFDPDGTGIVTLSLRDDNKYYVLDGQHRQLAALAAGYGTTKAKCQVYRNLTLAEEAHLFLVLNDARAVTGFDKFNVGLIAEDPRALAIDQTVRKHGWRISRQTRDGEIRCIGVVEELHKSGLLDDALATVTAAWGTRVSGVDAAILAGVAAVLGRYNGEVDHASLVHKLSKYRGGPTALLGNARGLRDLKSGMTVSRAVAEVIVDSYNKSRRSGALPPL